MKFTLVSFRNFGLIDSPLKLPREELIFQDTLAGLPNANGRLDISRIGIGLTQRLIPEKYRSLVGALGTELFQLPQCGERTFLVSGLCPTPRRQLEESPCALRISVCLGLKLFGLLAVISRIGSHWRCRETGRRWDLRGRILRRGSGTPGERHGR